MKATGTASKGGKPAPSMPAKKPMGDMSKMMGGKKAAMPMSPGKGKK